MTLLKKNISFLLQNSFKKDLILIWTLRIAALLSGFVFILILVFVTIESMPVLNHTKLTAFFTDSSWHPKENLFNLVPMIFGSILSSIGAIVIAAPLGILSAIFCSYYAPLPVAWSYRRMIELLSGIPSVVYGLWGLTVLVPLVGDRFPPGAGLLSGIIILSIMILPTMALTADASFSAVPKQYLNAAAALGLSKSRTVFEVIIPFAKPALLTGLILQAGRALGETMAILMVAGNVVQIPTSIFSPVRTLTANIALEMAYADDNHRSALFFSGLILIITLLVLVSVTELLKPKSFGEFLNA